jgi:hypothetical protein
MKFIETILSIPVILIKFIFKNKILLLVAIVGLGYFTYTNYQRSKQPQQAAVTTPAYQQIAPTKDAAPIVFTTPTRVYYVAGYTETGDCFVLTKFYSYDSKQWQYNTNPLPLRKDSVKIYNR